MSDNVKLYGFAILFTIVILASMMYWMWYWENCAFVPVNEMPGLCFYNR